MDVLTIDFNSADAPKTFTKSLKDTGFAVLSNHSIKFDQIQKVYDEWNDFFSKTYKIDYLFDDVKQDGFFPFLSEQLIVSGAQATLDLQAAAHDTGIYGRER